MEKARNLGTLHVSVAGFSHNLCGQHDENNRNELGLMSNSSSISAIFGFTFNLAIKFLLQIFRAHCISPARFPSFVSVSPGYSVEIIETSASQSMFNIDNLIIVKKDPCIAENIHAITVFAYI